MSVSKCENHYKNKYRNQKCNHVFLYFAVFVILKKHITVIETAVRRAKDVKSINFLDRRKVKKVKH